MGCNVLVFWGKTDSSLSWHPAISHMIDVGAVAGAVVDRAWTHEERKVFAGALGLSAERASTCVALLCALHDLGKTSPGFQKKVPELFRRLEQGGLPVSEIDLSDHAAATHRALCDILKERGLSSFVASDIAGAVAAHHGMFRQVPDSSAGMGGQPWDTARVATIAELERIFEIRLKDLKPRYCRMPPQWLITLAGLTSVSDWIGSDVRYFPFESTPGDLADYARRARQRAEKALTAVGWGAWKAAGGACDFGELFYDTKSGARIGWSPNDMQHACAKAVDAATGPFMLLVEAPTGTGKTEAALWAAQRYASRSGAQGMYYALPTQATSNQMLVRIEEFLGTLFRGDFVQLQLLHGLADLNETFSAIKARAFEVADDEDEVVPCNITSCEGEAEGDVIANEWFCARKRGLLAPFAVGTVDQALMGALRVRHMFVRLFGLARKVVVIDEVHAYDTYTSTLLDRVLEWLGALGSSAILLSATLPAQRRREFIEAYTGHLPEGCAGRYPRITLASGGSLAAVSLPHTGSQEREVLLKHVPAEACVQLLAGKLEGGGCAAWIANTVSGAQEAYTRLKRDPRFADTDFLLFHARFPVEERLSREKAVLDRFGKHSARPRKAVVVATQVIEQSLDVDFDVMVSDIAPIDLILQRAGRLHRHGRSRPALLQKPELYWVEPGSPTADQPDFGPSAHIYKEYILLRTWLLLRTRELVRLPDDTEEWIEAVYGSDEPPVPVAPDLAGRLKALRDDCERERRKEAGMASLYRMPSPHVPDGFQSAIHDTLDDSDEVAQKMTRLSDPSITIVCLHRTATGLSFTPDGSEVVSLDDPPRRNDIRRFLARSVSISNWYWYKHFKDEPCPTAWKNAALLRSCRAAVFTDGQLSIDKQLLVLDPELGLRFLYDDPGGGA